MTDFQNIAVGAYRVALIDDDRICGHIKAGHDFEPITLECWYDVIRRGPIGWVIDVGAYSGLFSIAAAKSGHRALAVEPLVELQERIAANATHNHVRDHIVIVPAAATNYSGEIGIGVNDKVHLTSGASVLRKSNQRIVPAWRVDDFDPDDLPINAIKIDVERAEMQVLEGAEQTISTHKPEMIVECLDVVSRLAVTEWLGRFGYRERDYMDSRNLYLTTHEYKGVLF